MGALHDRMLHHHNDHSAHRVPLRRQLAELSGDAKLLGVDTDVDCHCCRKFAYAVRLSYNVEEKKVRADSTKEIPTGVVASGRIS
jgi:hypothetical protein